MDYGMSVSNTGTVTVNVAWVDAAPTLTLDGSTSSVSVTIARNSTVVFNIVIGDIDSKNVSLLMTKNSIPFGTSGSYSSAFLTDPSQPSNPITITSNTTVLLNQVPLPPRMRNYNISWTPSVNIPDGQSSGAFSLQAQDPEGKTSIEITVNLAVTQNNPPVTNTPSPVTLLEDGSTIIDLFGTDPDPWHNTKLTFCITSLPDHGSISLGNLTFTTTSCVPVTSVPNTVTNGTLRTVTYTPTPIWYGNDTFSYQFEDLLGATSSVQTLSLTITHVNHPPTSKGLNLTTPLNTPLPFTLTGVDVDHDSLTFHISSDISKFTGANGTIKITSSGVGVSAAANVSASSSGTLDLLYTPPYGLQVSNPYFKFYVSDFPNDVVGPYYVHITVGPPTTHDPPVSQSFNTSLKQDTSVDIILDSYVSDPDGIAINIYIQTLPTNGILVLPSGTKITSVPTQIVANPSSPLYKLTYVPTTRWWGQDQFTYDCVDLYNISSVNSVVGITVIHVNSPPNITVSTNSITVGRTTSGTVTVSVVDIDSENIVVSLASLIPLPSVLEVNSTTNISNPMWNVTNSPKGIVRSSVVSWTPGILLGDGNTGSLQFLATDTEGATCGPLTVSLAVIKNHPPINLGGGPITCNENNPGVPITVTGDDLDSYDKSVLSVLVTSLPTNGKLTLNGVNVQTNIWISSSSRSNTDGQNTTYTFLYVPNAYVFGDDSFSIMFEDHLGVETPIATVNIVVTFVDTPPSSGNKTVSTYTDDTVTFSLPGPVDLDNDPVTLHILPPANFEGNLVFDQVSNFSITTLTSEFTITGHTPWTFSYESDDVVTTGFQFYLTDPYGGTSPYYSVDLIVTLDPSILPPLVHNATFNVTQGSTIDFDFLSLVTNRDNKNIIWVQILSNPNSSAIGPNPNLGTLRGANGIPFGSATSTPFLTPVSGVPTPFLASFTSVNSGIATFTYCVCDSTILVSNNATITINIIHVNFPPTITVIPTSTLIEDRGQTGAFSIAVTDPDSYHVTLSIRTDPVYVLPLDYCNMNFVPSNATSLTNNPNYVPLITQGPPYEASIYYTPDFTMPDSTVGTFVLEACDEQGACSSEETRSVTVSPNHSPKVVDVTGHDYNLVNKEGEMRIITLTGSDLDWYHTKKLTFVFLSTTKGGPLSLCTPDGNVTETIYDSSLPLSILGEPDDVNNRTYLVVCYSPLEFYLSVDPTTGIDIPDSFRFYVVDLLSAASSTQKVTINTNESVPHPPTSSDTILYVSEHDCLVDSCGTPITSPPFVQIPVTAVDATASSNYSLVFLTNENITGELFTTNSSGEFVSVPLDTPIPRPWRFYYQPPSGQFLNDSSPYLVLPYVIYVDDTNSSVYYLSIYVQPVNDPPVGADIVFYSSMNVPGNVTLSHSDPDDPISALVLYIVNIPVTNQAAFTSLDGTPVSLNTQIDSWTLIATPNQDVYSNPSTNPIATIQYQIVDHHDEGPDKRSSDIYTVSFIVNYVYYPIHYAADPSTTMAEDTTCLITLDNNGPSGWFGGNKEYQRVSIILYHFHEDNQPGNYSICDAFSNCSPVNESDLPVLVPKGSQVKFAPDANLNGQNFSRFDFNVVPVTPVPTLNVTWTINVTPVNDPPVTIPLNYIPITAALGSEANRCDENTTFVAIFYATDIDSPLDSLYSQWLTLLDDMPYDFYDCGNVTSIHPDVRNSSCSQGVAMDITLPAIPLDGTLARWKVFLVPNLGYFTSFKSVDFSVRTLDNYNAPSVPVKATINVDPINTAPYFEPQGGDNLFLQSSQGNYVLIRGYVKDPDFQRGYPIKLTVTTEDGTLGLPFSQSKCVLKNNNQTLICLDLIEKINTFFYQKNPSGIPFYPPSLDVSLSAAINFEVNDLGNIGKGNNLTCNATTYVTQEVAITAAAAKGGNTAVTSIAAGVGVACAVGIGIAAAVLFKSSKAATDLYLAEFVSNLDSAGNMYNPLYTEATKKAVNPFYAGAGGNAAT